MKSISRALWAGGLVLATLLVNGQAYGGESLDDATIFATFDEANTTDVWAGRIAIKKAQSAEVRALGKMVASDHEAVQQSWRDFAKKLGIMPTPRCAITAPRNWPRWSTCCN